MSERCSMIPRTEARHIFAALSERGIPGQVGLFAERVVAKACRGTVPVDDNVPVCEYADVVNIDAGLAMQVRACNARHCARIEPAQIKRLYKETRYGFLLSNGFYALVFYRGVHWTKKRAGKSKFFSRKFSRSDRQRIIAEDLQYIYVVGVKLMRRLLRVEGFLKQNGIVFDPEHHPHRSIVLALSRHFLAGFIQPRGFHRHLLHDVYGRGWVSRTIDGKRLTFDGNGSGIFQKKIPIHVIGGQNAKVVLEILGRESDPIPL